jgi:hypothetical protein
MADRLLDIFHLIQVSPITLDLHVVAMDEPQRGRVDAIAQAASIRRAIGKNVPEVCCRHVERTSVRAMPWLVSSNSFPLAGSIGLVKLGQPQPDSYLSDEAKSGSPDTMST